MARTKVSKTYKGTEVIYVLTKDYFDLLAGNKRNLLAFDNFIEEVNLVPRYMSLQSTISFHESPTVDTSINLERVCGAIIEASRTACSISVHVKPTGPLNHIFKELVSSGLISLSLKGLFKDGYLDEIVTFEAGLDPLGVLPGSQLKKM